MLVGKYIGEKQKQRKDEKGSGRTDRRTIIGIISMLRSYFPIIRNMDCFFVVMVHPSSAIIVPTVTVTVRHRYCRRRRRRLRLRISISHSHCSLLPFILSQLLLRELQFLLHFLQLPL